MNKKRLAVLCISDRSAAGIRKDQSGPAITQQLSDITNTVAYSIIPDDKEKIKSALLQYAEDDNIDIIITTGGTGLAPRDVTPEATLSVADRIVPGISEEIRRQSILITPNAMLSRGVSVVCNNTLIVNLPGSTKAVKECCEIIRPIINHAVELLKEEVIDCANDVKRRL